MIHNLFRLQHYCVCLKQVIVRPFGGVNGIQQVLELFSGGEAGGSSSNNNTRIGVYLAAAGQCGPKYAACFCSGRSQTLCRLQPEVGHDSNAGRKMWHPHSYQCSRNVGQGKIIAFGSFCRTHHRRLNRRVDKEWMES